MTAYELLQMQEWCQDQLEVFIYVQVEQLKKLKHQDDFLQDTDLNCN